MKFNEHEQISTFISVALYFFCYNSYVKNYICALKTFTIEIL